MGENNNHLLTTGPLGQKDEFTLCEFLTSSVLKKTGKNFKKLKKKIHCWQQKLNNSKFQLRFH